ncbi:helix-turn-helix domain-containing protein [Actinoallomurus sp. NPDC050550]|uniref:winged helix-turn-helix transcriptional regulator n=1 Tax=Actinoallomurus sp. NPDC050550 TaxID=3154937 RepID=UPI0033EBDFE7
MAHQGVGHGQGLLDACSGPVVEPNPNCPVEITLGALRGRWTPLILGEFLRSGELSYSQLAAALTGLSDKVLSERLAQLTEAGILERRRTPAWPPRVTYALTDRGRALAPVLEALWSWGRGDAT